MSDLEKKPTNLDMVREASIGRVVKDIVWFDVDNYDGSTCGSYRIDFHDDVSVEFEAMSDDNERWIDPTILRGLK